MKCVVISPREGAVRISRFKVTDMEPADGKTSLSIQEICAGLEDIDDIDGLNSRLTAPLRLSRSLRARLPGAVLAEGGEN